MFPIETLHYVKVKQFLAETWSTELFYSVFLVFNNHYHCVKDPKTTRVINYLINMRSDDLNNP